MMLFFDQDAQEFRTIGQDKDALKIDGDVVTVEKDMLVKALGGVAIIGEDGLRTNVLRTGKKYKLELDNEFFKFYELIEPNRDKLDEVDWELLKLLVANKEIKLMKKLVETDWDDLDSIEEYEKVLHASKNFRFVPELTPYNLAANPETVEAFKEIFKVRTKIYENASEAEKNHVVFCIKNPVIWLDVDNKVKRILCGELQYRKGLHTRDFDLMVYNLNLLTRFKLNEDKIKFANLMRDYNLL